MGNKLKKSLFWDVDREKLSYEDNQFFIIERILEFGDIDDLFWIKENFSEEKIKDTVKRSKCLSPRTLSYCKAAGYAS
jgi:hypothetical protein